jgi:hypothetical protein
MDGAGVEPERSAGFLALGLTHSESPRRRGRRRPRSRRGCRCG